jgi:hypothetical protein
MWDMADEQGQSKYKSSGSFVKGDKRINRKGRPKSFETLRKEAQKLAGEIIDAAAEGGAPVEMSRIHSILLDWATSRDPRKQELFVSYAYGKVPQKEEITGADGGAQKMIIEVVRRGSENGAVDSAGTSPDATGD